MEFCLKNNIKKELIIFKFAKNIADIFLLQEKILNFVEITMNL